MSLKCQFVELTSFELIVKYVTTWLFLTTENDNLAYVNEIGVVTFKFASIFI